MTHTEPIMSWVKLGKSFFSFLFMGSVLVIVSSADYVILCFIPHVILFLNQSLDSAGRSII